MSSVFGFGKSELIYNFQLFVFLNVSFACVDNDSWAISQLLVYLHAKVAADADDTGDNRSEEVPAADLNSTKYTPSCKAFYSVQSV